MRQRRVSIFAITVVVLAALDAVVVLSQQDRYALKVPDGLALSEFRGYDAWQIIAVSQTESSVKAILGNPTMIAATRKVSLTMANRFPRDPRPRKSNGSRRRIPRRHISWRCRTI